MGKKRNFASRSVNSVCEKRSEPNKPTMKLLLLFLTAIASTKYLPGTFEDLNIPQAVRRGFSPYSMLMKNDYFKKKRNVVYEKKTSDELDHEDLADWEKMYEDLYHSFPTDQDFAL